MGKVNALPDIVKAVYRDLVSGRDRDFKIPESARAVAQCLIQFQSSHRPRDLDHFVTPDFRKSVLWIQLKTGDNVDMTRVGESVDDWIAANPPPLPLKHSWFGLTWINTVWQDKMVSGMLSAFLGSFLVVFIMMSVVYRSALWGFLAMVPLTVTIGLIYGMIGLIGKDYDMPVAVLSSLSLGLAVDYAIHFLTRSRELRARYGSWAAAAGPVFGEPARAIARNVIVVGVGFLPLLAAPLVPYQTVGTFIAAILLVAGVASLLILPALIALLEKWLFPPGAERRLACRCVSCAIVGTAAVITAALNLHQFLSLGWTRLTFPGIAAVVVLALICWFSSRSSACRTGGGDDSGKEAEHAS